MKCSAYKWRHALKAFISGRISPHDKPTNVHSVGSVCLALLCMTVVCGPDSSNVGRKWKVPGRRPCFQHFAKEDGDKGGIEGNMQTTSKGNNKMVNTMLWLLKSGWLWKTVTLLSVWGGGRGCQSLATKTLAMQPGERERNHVRSTGEVGDREDKGRRGDTGWDSGEQRTERRV